MKRHFASQLLIITMLVLLTGFVRAGNAAVTQIGQWGGGNIADVFVKGNYAYCAATDYGFVIHDVSDPANPRKVADVDIPGAAWDVFVSGNHAYVTYSAYSGETKSGFLVFDISSPASPALTGEYRLTKLTPTEIKINGSHAYLLAAYNDDDFWETDYQLHIIDISNPASPVLTASYRTSERPTDIAFSGNYACIAMGVFDASIDGSRGAVEIIDISDPAAPSPVAKPDSLKKYWYSVSASGNYFYLSGRDYYPAVVNISNPASPTVTSLSRKFSDSRNCIHGDHVFFTAHSGVYIYDITDPGSPVEKGHYSTGAPSAIFAGGNYAYTNREIIDVSNVSSPSLAGSFDNPNVDIFSLHVEGNYAYMADFNSSKLRIADVSNASSPDEAGSIALSNRPRDVRVNGNYAYVAATGHLAVVDVSKASAPVQKGSYTIDSGTVSKVVAEGNYAYVLEDRYSSRRLLVLDVSNPASPSLTGEYTVEDYLRDIDIRGSYAYMISNGVLHILNVSVPAAPALVNTYTYDTSASTGWGIRVSGDYAYAAGNNGLHIIDVSSPAAPAAVGYYATQESVFCVWVEDDYAYLGVNDGKIHIVNISTPSSPVLAATYDTGQRPRGLIHRNGYLYAAYASKLKILSFDPSQSFSYIEVNRSSLTFAADTAGNVTAPQSFLVNKTGSALLTWTASANRDWLTVSPGSGSNSGEITVSVDASNLATGTYAGTVTISSPNAANSPQTVSVSLTVHGSGQTSLPFGVYATPTNGATVSGSIPVTGWVLDDIGVQAVQLFREQGNALVFIGDAIFVEGVRPDVEAAYPDYPMNHKAGWGYMLLTNYLPNNGNGTFGIRAIVTDLEGNQVSLGTKTITCDNANAVKPFGAIDTPDQGGAASGSAFINWGWALTPQPNTIPIDGSTINVWVDGVKLGNPVYNIYREDIAAYFPGYNNSSGAVGYFYLDTTAYENGLHTIQWTVTDDAGNTDGIGSRFFTIQNFGSARAGSLAQMITPQRAGTGTEPVRIRVGYGPNTPSKRRYPDQDGRIRVDIKELDRIEIRFPGGAAHRLTGYLAVGQYTRNLPHGSTLNQDRGVFCWQTGVGHVGRFPLVFFGTDRNGNSTRFRIDVTVNPRH